jgi:hypothetical protein
MDLIRSHQNGTSAGIRIRVTDPEWTTLARGVRVHGKPPLTHRLLTAGALHAANRTAVACDLTAAHWWSMVVPSGFGLDVDAQACAIATMRDGNRLRAAGVRGRRLELPVEHITLIDGFAITTPARTWMDCAALVSWRDIVAMGDGLLRSRLATPSELSRMVAWGRGRRGIKAARAALPVLDAASESPGESWVRALLARSRLPRPICNLSVTVDGWTFRLDLGWPDQRVAVEYDGEEFHGPKYTARDAWRREKLREAGWIILVVRKDDLADGARLIRRLTEHLSARA